MKKWSGDHGGFDFATTAGVLITNRPINTATPRIIDIAPTVLQFYGSPGSGHPRTASRFFAELKSHARIPSR